MVVKVSWLAAYTTYPAPKPSKHETSYSPNFQLPWAPMTVCVSENRMFRIAVFLDFSAIPNPSARSDDEGEMHSTFRSTHHSLPPALRSPTPSWSQHIVRTGFSVNGEQHNAPSSGHAALVQLSQKKGHSECNAQLPFCGCSLARQRSLRMHTTARPLAAVASHVRPVDCHPPAYKAITGPRRTFCPLPLSAQCGCLPAVNHKPTGSTP